MSDRVAEPMQGTRALFIFHLTLLSWWMFVQLYYRVAPRFIKADPSFPMAVVSLALIVTALIVTAQFARGQRGTASETAARVAVVLAVVDVLGETLQFAPRLGLPSVIPSDKSATEFVVRGIWASSEFAMRSAVFIALWRALPHLEKRIAALFFLLIGVNYFTAMLSFARVVGPFTELANAVPFGPLLTKINLPMGLLWLAIIVYLARRVASQVTPATELMTANSG